MRKCLTHRKAISATLREPSVNGPRGQPCKTAPKVRQCMQGGMGWPLGLDAPLPPLRAPDFSQDPSQGKDESPLRPGGPRGGQLHGRCRAAPTLIAPLRRWRAARCARSIRFIDARTPRAPWTVGNEPPAARLADSYSGRRCRTPAAKLAPLAPVPCHALRRGLAGTRWHAVRAEPAAGLPARGAPRRSAGRGAQSGGRGARRRRLALQCLALGRRARRLPGAARRCARRRDGRPAPRRVTSRNSRRAPRTLIRGPHLQLDCPLPLNPRKT